VKNVRTSYAGLKTLRRESSIAIAVFQPNWHMG
jgi:hypothetical protein